MPRADQERDYWDMCALDPQVKEKYICDPRITDESCVALIADCFRGKHPRLIVEIGSGIGRLTVPIAERFHRAKVWGIDISPRMREIAQPHERVTYSDAWPEGEIDAIYSMLVFQHMELEDVKNYIREGLSRLKKAGVFVFQFIEGQDDEEAPFSKRHPLEEILSCAPNAIAIGHLLHPQWTWVIAEA